MKDKLIKLIAESVEKNMIFQGAVGTAYTVQDLLHNVGVKSINNIWKRTKKELDSLSTDSLFESSNSVRSKLLQLQLDTLIAVFEHKQDIIKSEKELNERRQKASEKLAVLSKIKTEKEIEALGSMSIEDIDKEIEKYSV